MTDYKSKIIEIIALKAGVEPSEVTPESFFEDDLNLGEMEIAEITEEIEDMLSIDLSEHKGNIASVADFLDIIEEKVE